MSKKTVRQLAEIIKIPLDRLLIQLKEAGLNASSAEDEISEDEKSKLLAHLRHRHGKTTAEGENSPSRVVLKRRKVSELKQASVPGSATKTISVEVRKQKTYIKRTEAKDVEADKAVAPVAAAQSDAVLSTAQTDVAPRHSEEGGIELPRVESISTPPSSEQREPALAKEGDDADGEAVVATKHDDKNLSKAKKSVLIEDEEDFELEPEVVLEAKFAVAIKDDKNAKQDKVSRAKESDELRKSQLEKEQRLEDSVKRTAEKVRQQAAAKQKNAATAPVTRTPQNGAKTGQTPSRPAQQNSNKAQAPSALAGKSQDASNNNRNRRAAKVTDNGNYAQGAGKDAKRGNNTGGNKKKGQSNSHHVLFNMTVNINLKCPVPRL